VCVCWCSAHLWNMSVFVEGQHPRGKGGRFVSKAKPGAGVSLGAGEEDVARHVAREAMLAGDRLAGEQAIALHEAGQVPSGALMAADRELFCRIGDEVIYPALDDLEDVVRDIHDDGDPEPGGDEWPLLPRDGDRLRQACRQAGVPDVVASYVEALDDREVVSSRFLASFGPAELSRVDDEVVAPAAHRVRRMLMDQPEVRGRDTDDLVA